MKNPKKFKFGSEMLTCKEISKITAVCLATVYEKVRRGYTEPSEFIRKKRSGSSVPKYKFGSKMLTALEISKKVGLSKSTVLAKINKGYTQPSQFIVSVPTHKFGDKMLTVKEIANIVKFTEVYVRDKINKGAFLPSHFVSIRAERRRIQGDNYKTSNSVDPMSRLALKHI